MTVTRPDVLGAEQLAALTPRERQLYRLGDFATGSDEDELFVALANVRLALAAKDAQIQHLRDELDNLERRIREQSPPLVEVLNLMLSGGTPTEDQKQRAVEAYKWAVYGTAIAAQMVLAFDGDPRHALEKAKSE